VGWLVVHVPDNNRRIRCPCPLLTFLRGPFRIHTTLPFAAHASLHPLVYCHTTSYYRISGCLPSVYTRHGILAGIAAGSTGWCFCTTAAWDHARPPPVDHYHLGRHSRSAAVTARTPIITPLVGRYGFNLPFICYRAGHTRCYSHTYYLPRHLCGTPLYTRFSLSMVRAFPPLPCPRFSWRRCRHPRPHTFPATPTTFACQFCSLLPLSLLRNPCPHRPSCPVTACSTRHLGSPGSYALDYYRPFTTPGFFNHAHTAFS